MVFEYVMGVAKLETCSKFMFQGLARRWLNQEIAMDTVSVNIVKMWDGLPGCSRNLVWLATKDLS